MRAELLLDCRNTHGEGIFWSSTHGLLYWTDIHGECVWTYQPQVGRAEKFKVPGRVCCFAERKGRPPNEVIAAFADGFALLDLSNGERRDIAAFEPDLPTTRLNDGRTDRQGRFIAGGMDEDGAKPISSVWQLNPDLTLTRLFGDVGCANGTCFSPDGRTMWFADSPTRRIDAFDYDPKTGALGARRTVANTQSPGVPDGSCVDAEGFIWNVVWEGYRVERWSPEGKLDRVIDVPVKKPTCCAFGGENLATLFITSSRLGETDDELRNQPQSGGLFQVQPGARGIEDQPFGG